MPIGAGLGFDLDPYTPRMWLFWWIIVEPLLRAHRPAVMVEIGSESGKNLANLIRFAMANAGHVHSIDPKPLFDVEEWTRRAQGRLTVHRGTSLQVLPRLDALDAVFIDGDHNWVTVYHELMATGKRCADLGRTFPLVLLHDIGWPWGRRDLYYAPDAIPAEFRHPYTKPQPGSAPAADLSGAHLDFCRAQHEGGARNGVLTAVEDYLAQSQEPLDLIKLPGFAGLGILASKAVRRSNPDLDAFLSSLAMSPVIEAYMEFLEAGRVRRPVRFQASSADPNSAQYPG
jgi:hypothetical protein